MTEQGSMANTRLPDFLVVGAAKSATSSLHEYLDQHPQIKMPSQKESWFFSFYNKPVAYDSPGKLSDLVSELDEYLHLYDGASNSQILGDACPSYLYTYEDTIKNIRLLYSVEALKNLKIIISLREPVSRAYSQYYTFKRKVEEPLSFEQAVMAETVKQRMQNNWNIFYDYTGFGLYSKQVEAFQQAFGKQSVMVVLFDEVHKDMPAVCRSLYRFLGVDADFTVDDKEKHNSFAGEPSLKWLVAGLFSKNKFKRKISSLIPKPLRMLILYVILKPLLRRKELDEDTRLYLADFFRADILRLEKLIDQDLSAWRDKA
jgi:hypothetical protein